MTSLEDGRIGFNTAHVDEATVGPQESSNYDNQTRSAHATGRSTIHQHHMPNFFEEARGFSVHGGQFYNAASIVVSPPPQLQVAEVRPISAPRSQSAIPHPESAQDEKESEIYARLLCPKGRGFPLWCPQPSAHLPQVYQEKGIGIGDVGIITTDGEFDFLFNILHPSDHPINQNRVPVGFQPLEAGDLDITGPHLEHSHGESVLSGSIQGRQGSAILPNGASSEYCFDCDLPKGAILILPEGSTRNDLLSKAIFRNYASRNGEAWYQYANGPRARDALNGSLHLVTGYDKGTCWAVSAFSRISRSPCTTLQFTVDIAHGAENDADYWYSWRKIGPGRLKHGPNPVPREMNQSLFIRTFTIHLNSGIWSRLFGSSSVEVRSNDTKDYENLVSRPWMMARGTQKSSSFSSWWPTSPASNSHSLSNSSMLDREYFTPDATIISNFPNSSRVDHPAKMVNEYLFAMVPHAKIAIAHDNDWCSVLTEDDHEVPGHSEFFQRIERTHNIMHEDDVVFFSRKEGTVDLRLQRTQQADQSNNKIQSDTDPIREDALGVIQTSESKEKQEISTPPFGETLPLDLAAYSPREKMPYQQILSQLIVAPSISDEDAIAQKLGAEEEAAAMDSKTEVLSGIGIGSRSPSYIFFNRLQDTSQQEEDLPRSSIGVSPILVPQLIPSVDDGSSAEQAKSDVLRYGNLNPPQTSRKSAHDITFASSSSKVIQASETRSITESSSTLLDPNALDVNQFIDRELLRGVSLGFAPPNIPAQLIPKQVPVPSLISLPYGKSPAFYIQAPNWRHALKLMARMSGSRMEPSMEALNKAKTNNLKLRTVVQFVKPHPTEWRTVLWFTIDYPVPLGLPNSQIYNDQNVDVLPWSYTLSEVPDLLSIRGASDGPLSKTYTIPATESVPFPTLPVTLPGLAMYLRIALLESRIHLNDSSSGFGKFARMVQECYSHLSTEEHYSLDQLERRSGALFKRSIGQRSRPWNIVKGRGTNEELVTPFKADEWL